jgi:hypothetical protein
VRHLLPDFTDIIDARGLKASEAQRFPVRLTIEEGARPKGGVRYGSQVTVVIYTGDNPVTNAWGSLWIRIMSVLTYVN